MKTHPRAIRSFVAAALLVAVSAIGEGQATTSAAAGSNAAPGGPAAPPASFRQITLGMGPDAVKDRLRADPLFRFRGDPDVSFLPQSDDPLIECDGSSYIKRAWFQFVEGKLAVMILVLNDERVDYYSLFTAFSAKYGEPRDLSPREAVWLSETVRFSLERPLAVKYLERATFDRETARGAAQQDLELLSRERFIEQF